MTLADVLKSALAVAKDDANKSIIPALATFFSSVAANPSVVGRVAALAQLNAAVLTALPTIQQDVLKDIATLLGQEAQELLTKRG